MARIKINSSKSNRIAEIFGNISVAWFIAGVITPLFNDLLFVPIIISLISYGFFFWFSLLFTKKG